MANAPLERSTQPNYNGQVSTHTYIRMGTGAVRCYCYTHVVFPELNLWEHASRTTSGVAQQNKANIDAIRSSYMCPLLVVLSLDAGD